MADLAVTAKRVAVVNPMDACIRPYIAGVGLTAGQSIFLQPAGTVALCDANVGGAEQFRGIALETVGAGQVVDVLEEGDVEGFDLSAINPDALVYASDNAGALATAASATKTVQVGRVSTLPSRDSSGVIKRVLRISIDVKRNW